MSFIPYVFVFLIGLSFGSFINAFEYRLKIKKSFISSRSACPHCHHQLSWFDLIPLLSWLWLRGKCRYCNRGISPQYPLVELATGILFVAGYISVINGISARLLEISNWKLDILSELSPTLPTVFRLLFTFLIITALEIIFIYDLKYGLIPDEVVFPMIVLVLVYQAASAFGSSEGNLSYIINQMGNLLLSGLGAALFFILLIVITRGKGMGGGDVKLALLMGLILGFPQIITALYLAFITGAVISLILLAIKRKRFGQTIPFGPFLAASTLVVLLCS